MRRHPSDRHQERELTQPDASHPLDHFPAPVMPPVGNWQARRGKVAVTIEAVIYKTDDCLSDLDLFRSHPQTPG